MLNQKSIFSVGVAVFLLFLLPVISSAGLSIEQTEIYVNKTYGQEIQVRINVTNEETFKFYNITFKENIVSVPKFDLEPGETKEVMVSVTGNDDYNGLLTLRGEYQSQIGASNKTETILINYNSGFNKCNLDMVKGDKIVWVNNVQGNIELVNNDNGVKFLDILQGENVTYSLSNPTELHYYARWVGFKFTNVCTINVIGDSGMVHKLEYDDTINIDLKVSYDPTTISVTFLGTQYEVAYNGEKSDIFKIENTGSKAAKKIHISADWMTFDKNDFDLNSGDSVNVAYTIKPLIIETNQTNKTHTKTIEITGNFEKKVQDILVFIPYKQVDVITGTPIDEEVIQNFIKSYCTNELDKCIDLFCSIYPEECENGLSGGGVNVTQEFSSDALKSLIEGYAQLLQNNEQREKGTTQTDVYQTQQIENLSANNAIIMDDIDSVYEEVRDLKIAVIFFIVFALFLMSGLVVYYLKFSGGSSLMRTKLKIYR